MRHVIRKKLGSCVIIPFACTIFGYGLVEEHSNLKLGIVSKKWLKFLFLAVACRRKTGYTFCTTRTDDARRIF